MAASTAAAPGVGVPWRWTDFLRAELHPYPGIYSRLLRVIFAVVVTFLILATFRMPYAAISLYTVFTIDRSSRRASVLRATESIVAITIGVAMALAGVVLFIDQPLLTFVYYALELFIAAFLIRTTRLPGPAMNMSMAMYSVHNVWERGFPAGLHVEQTLWVWLTLCLGFLVSVPIEFGFAREDPMHEIYSQVADRLRAVADFFESLATGRDASLTRKRVLSLAAVSTAAIRYRILSLRNTERRRQQELLGMNTATALTARLVDISATLNDCAVESEEDQLRWHDLSRQLRQFADVMQHRKAVQAIYEPAAMPSASYPVLPELERTAAMMPAAFSEREAIDRELGPVPPDRTPGLHIFVPDAFTNPGYLLFALKTMLAAMLCYVTYMGFHWPGISTSVVTCMVTALNTIGATRQKQILRLTGASAGGAIALLSIVLILPETDSISAVTLLVAAVSTFGAWFTLASPRLSYFGLQTALAFYLAFIQDYSAPRHLAPARDRALGVLLGIAMMWLVFDNLWPVSAAEHMRAGLARNIRLLANLVTALDQPDRNAAIAKIRTLRDRIQNGFAAVNGHADSVLFEFTSRDRAQKLALRECMLRLQATLRTLFVVEIAVCQYRTQVVPGTRPPEVRAAQNDFDNALAQALDGLADAVQADSKLAAPLRLEPELTQLEQRVEPWVASLTNQWILTRVAGIRDLNRRAVALAQRLANDFVACQ